MDSAEITTLLEQAEHYSNTAASAIDSPEHQALTQNYALLFISRSLVVIARTLVDENKEDEIDKRGD